MTLFATSDTTFLEKQQLHIRRKIGEGSFSKVYLSRFGAVAPTADDEAQATLIATKVINKNRVSAKFVEKFLPRELDVLLKLRHPFLVQASVRVFWVRIQVAKRVKQLLVSFYKKKIFFFDYRLFIHIVTIN